MKIRYILLAILCLIVIASCAKPKTIEKIPDNIKIPTKTETTISTTVDCMDNLDRFAGTYLLEVKSKEVGIQDYQEDGEIICGKGEDFFGALPASVTIEVNGNTASMKTNVDSKSYSISGTFQQPTEPKIPLVQGSFYKSLESVKQVLNSCGTKSTYISELKKYADDEGQTTETVFVYAQKDALYIVVDSFWIADESEILSPCHGVMIIQGTK